MAKTYDLNLVICTVGSVRIGGYGETDAIGIEWDEKIVEKTVTADGDTIYSRLNNRGLTITFTLSQKSRSHLLLSQLLETQHGDNLGLGPPVILSLPFSLQDYSTGENIFSLDCVFVSRPAASKNRTVGDVQYEMHLPKPRITPALANLI